MSGPGSESESEGGGITGIDHTLVGVRDLEAARVAWQRLGFTVCPRGRHIGWGTANYCIMLAQGYIELLGIVDPGQFTNNLDLFLERREGLLGLAFASEDSAGCHRRLSAAGLHPEGPKDLKRILELPEGEALPAFKLVFLPPAETPGLSAFICQHLTPEMVWRPAWQAHANGAIGLASVTVAVDRPAEAVLGYAPLFGPEALWIADGAAEVETGQGRIRFVTSEGLARFYPGACPDIPPSTPWMAAMTIEVADIDHAEKCLRQRGAATLRSADGILVPPESATGTILEFRAA